MTKQTPPGNIAKRSQPALHSNQNRFGSDKILLLGNQTKLPNGASALVVEAAAAALLMLLQAAAAISTISANFKTAEWQDKVSQRLDYIIAAIDDIVRELQNLRDFIPIAIDEGFRKRIAVDVAAQKKEFDYIIAGVPDPKLIPLETRQRLAELAVQLRPTINALRGYGYFGHIAVGTGLITLLSIYTAAPPPRGELVAIRDDFLAWFRAASDPAVPDSVAQTANELLAASTPSKAFVDAMPRQGFLGYYEKWSQLLSLEPTVKTSEVQVYVPAREPRDRPDRPPKLIGVDCYYRTWEGTFESGIADHLLEVERTGGERNPRNWQPFPGCPSDSASDRENAANWRFWNYIWAPLTEHMKQRLPYLAGRKLEAESQALPTFTSSVEQAFANLIK
jgi:hypothetical protein